MTWRTETMFSSQDAERAGRDSYRPGETCEEALARFVDERHVTLPFPDNSFGVGWWSANDTTIEEQILDQALSDEAENGPLPYLTLGEIAKLQSSGAPGSTVAQMIRKDRPMVEEIIGRKL